MKKLCLLLTALIGAVTLSAHAEEGFVPLFDGKTMQGWHNAYTWGIK